MYHITCRIATMLVCDRCSLKCEDSLHLRVHSQSCKIKQHSDVKPQRCELCSKQCKNELHLKIHSLRCADIINNFTSKDQCPYCKMYGHQTPAAVTCCRIYKYYEGASIVQQIKDYYGGHYDRFFGSHFE